MHCGPIFILTGDHNLNGKEGYEQNIPIEKIIKHPQYAAHQNHDYDLALIKLQSPLTYNKRVLPVCLPKFDFAVDTKCYVTGWGHTQEGGDIPQVTGAEFEIQILLNDYHIFQLLLVLRM